MNAKSTLKGPLIHRFLIKFLTLIFAILIYRLLDFFMSDIASIEGPNYSEVKSRYLSAQLTNELERNNTAFEENERSIERKREELNLISDGSKNLQSTINQLIELHRLSIQKQFTLSASEQNNLSISLTQFLDNQKHYQTRNTELSNLIDRKSVLEAQQVRLQAQITHQTFPAKAEFDTLLANHELQLAYLQLLILIPLLLIGALFILKWRNSIYFPILFGYSVAIFLKTGAVIHEYFPEKYVKYVLLSVAIVVVIKILAYFITAIAFPKAQWLMKQYREAYESFLCPVCEYPIRTGPRKFLFWTRRTVNKVILPNDKFQEESYACPACGTMLFESCTKCNGIRHSLLPYCQNCGIETTVSTS
jgi:predicted RNA-binding Zn-ribbon protein involved in translation (DUF1610 family)